MDFGEAARDFRSMAKNREEVAVADMVLTAPVEELTDTEHLTPNPRGRRLKLQDPAPNVFYGGFDWLLVRTALIRAEGWTSKAKLPTVRGPDDIARLCRHLTFADQEHVVIVALNNSLEVMAICELHIGGASQAAIEPLHVLKISLLTGASRVAVVHNHPSGNPSPSSEDRTMTEALQRNLQCLVVDMVDSLVVARDGWSSILQGVTREWDQ
jgi:hypothetical protein